MVSFDSFNVYYLNKSFFKTTTKTFELSRVIYTYLYLYILFVRNNNWHKFFSKDAMLSERRVKIIYCGNQHFATLGDSSAELVMKLEHFFMIRHNYCHGIGLKWYTVGIHT